MTQVFTEKVRELKEFLANKRKEPDTFDVVELFMLLDEWFEQNQPFTRANLESVANAKLIATAPDLLESAIEFLEMWDEETAHLDSIGLFTDKKPEIEKIRAVIAKATGG